MNYATAVGYGDDSKTKEFNYWWPADVHIMAKEIVKFHAILACVFKPLIYRY